MKDEIITLRVDDLRAVFERVTGKVGVTYWTRFYVAIHAKALVTANDGQRNPDFPRLTQ